ncbi:hypothetical protein F0L68_28520 [Solihabitans fulvus]|uniref:tRNA synthetase class II core domain (G, H, P, S and T) n=1 Tax=Solihabitans fulvus TaxID=1892852 RepID=A0A5B2WTH6_9PSEU|nr:hypothetical protein [Solihabitans fulvus]KAA2255353.1 hypothetical protein F0L68_28520 [Solihabitans fulvus]
MDDALRGGALAILDPDHTALLRELDRTFAGWAAGAGEICPPPIYRIDDLRKFDIYKNFPHLSLVASELDVDRVVDAADSGAFGREQLLGARFGLPSATCYGAYLFYENSQVAAETTVTLVNRCFRREDSYGGLRRLLSFQMREIVAIGSAEHAQDLLARLSVRIIAFATDLLLDVEKVPASDPFFEQDGGRALLQKLSPVKHEFRCEDLAISSVNTHRNFFGERCAITTADTGEPAFTSCVAFGLERWVAVLVSRYGDPRKALAAVRDAAQRTN